MRRCDPCRLEVEGAWRRCPLCGTQLAGAATAPPFPDVPLRYSRRRMLQLLTAVSAVIVAVSYAAQPLLARLGVDLGAVRFAWIGVCTIWLLVMVGIRSHRSVGALALRGLLLVGPALAYWDWATGWDGWSLDYAIPILCASAILALMITLRLLRVQLAEHLHRSAATVLLGLVPMGFWLLGWAEVALPSVVCALVAVVALLTQLSRERAIRGEIARRLHL